MPPPSSAGGALHQCHSHFIWLWRCLGGQVQEFVLDSFRNSIPLWLMESSSSHQSSNYRKFRNLVNTAELELLDPFTTLTQLVDQVSSATLTEAVQHTELFLFTDNMVAEGAFYQCTSPNPKLFDLILCLHHLELHHSLHLHVIYVAGK